MRYLAESLLVPLRPELEKYENFMKASATDPPNEPYKSKYAAFGCLENMQEFINNWDDSPHQAAVQSAVLSACGVIKAETEEFATAEKFLSRSVEICDSAGEECYSILQRTQALIYLGVIWCGREDYFKSKDYLEKALKVHQEFQGENNQQIFTFRDLLWPGDYKVSKQTEDLESVITHAYYYLAQVEGKMGNATRSAELCHTTLARQLKHPDSLNHLDWSRNCATLSQFYLNQENFTAARYHLAAAQDILATYATASRAQMKAGEKNGEGEKAEEEDEEGKTEEELLSVQGHLSRLCGKYGLSLLEYSHCEKLTAEEGESSGGDGQKWATPCPLFPDLNINPRLDQVADTKIVELDTAKQTFLWAQKQFSESQKYYTMDERCSDYVEICRDISQLYKHLVAFEPENDNRCKMHRRRADMLEPLNRELNPEHYLLVIRQILFELGEIFSDLVDLKRERWLAEPNNPHFAKKVNTVVQKSTLYFQTFLDTMKVEGKDPVKYNDDNDRPALLAFFYLGRLASKFVVEENSQRQLDNINKTFLDYSKIVDYCKTNPDTAAKMTEELAACSEMVRLLPVKMEQIRRKLTV